MILKLIALRLDYFKSGWNNFDFLIVMAAWGSILLLEIFQVNIGPIATVVRSFRIMRILKIIKSSGSLRQVFNTFVLAIPALANLGVLLVLFLFMFSVLGVNLFASIKL